MVGEVDAVVCTLTDRVDAAVLAAGAKRLKVVANVAVGYDNIDVDAACRLGVTICNTPGVLDEATADITILLLLAAARRAYEAERDLRAGVWPGWRLDQYLGQEVSGRILGLVGRGRIGQAVERRATGFGMTTIHHTRRPTGEIGWTEDLDDLLAHADFVSIHVPLGPETHHLINQRRLRLMKPSAVLINTARGAIVDEAALADALEQGTIFAAGLDVFELEPEVHERLRRSPRTTLLPHVGSATHATRTRMAEMACEAVVKVLAGEVPSNAVNSAR